MVSWGIRGEGLLKLSTFYSCLIFGRKLAPVELRDMVRIISRAEAVLKAMQEAEK